MSVSFNRVMSIGLKPSLLPDLINKLFQRLNTEYSNNTEAEKKFSPEDLGELAELFGSDILESALDLIFRNKVIIYRSRSERREFIEIPGHNGIVYKLFQNINYCACQTFCEQVLLLKARYTCKHVLAAKLAILWRKEKVEIITADHSRSRIQ